MPEMKLPGPDHPITISLQSQARAGRATTAM